MSGAAKFLLFLAALPALAALGYDAHIAYEVEGARDASGFRLISLGWIVTTYAPEAHTWVIDQLRAVSPTLLPTYGWILEQKAFFAGLAVMLAVWALVGLAAVLAAGRGKAPPRKLGDYGAHQSAAAKALGRSPTTIEYKRH